MPIKNPSSSVARKSLSQVPASEQQHLLLADGLEVVTILETGLFSNLYSVRHRSQSLTTVLVLPLPLSPDRPDELHHFEKEVFRLMEVNEESLAFIPKILGHGITSHGHYPFVESESVEAATMDQILRSSGPLPLSEVVRAAEQLSRTLAFCHNLGLPHGALTIKSVLFEEAKSCYLLRDFGWGLLSETQRSSLVIESSDPFLAPEQKQGKLFFQTDVYRFGQVLFQLLTGQAFAGVITHKDSFGQELFGRRSKTTVKENNIPAWLTNLIGTCLQPNPDDRYSNALELYDQILLGNLMPLPKPEQTMSPAPRIEYLSGQEKNREKTESQTPDEAPSAPPVSETPKTRRTSLLRFALIVLIASATLAIFVPARKLSPGPVVAHTNPQPDTASTLIQKTQPPKQNAAEKTPDAKLSTAASKTQEPAVERRKATIPKTVSKKIREQPSEGYSLDLNTGLGSYKVISKAYFHTTPEEASKRAAFIVHWNNAVIKPIEEKNDFIYIVFTNHWGQTSKGWLRKKDLRRIDE